MQLHFKAKNPSQRSHNTADRTVSVYFSVCADPGSPDRRTGTKAVFACSLSGINVMLMHSPVLTFAADCARLCSATLAATVFFGACVFVIQLH